MASRFEVVVIGCGPGGERAAIQAARAGARVAVIEKAHVVGGARINWGTIPSKTLRESALFVYYLTRLHLHGIRTEIAEEITVSDFMYREQQVVQRELELLNQSLGRYRIEVFKGRGRFVDANRVAVVGAVGQTRVVLEADQIVIATGASPNRPADVPFDLECIFDSDTILKLPRMPKSMIVLGAGVIGVEYAAIFAALGLEVTLVDTRDQLLPYLDREIADRLEQELRRLGVVVVHGDQHEQIERLAGEPPRVRCRTAGGNTLEADILLFCVGRDGNSRDLALEPLGINPNDRGLLEVNEFYQTAHPHIYAVGDVIGYPALASTSMEQGRQAIRHALGLSGPKGRTEVLPFAIYAIPEVSYVGETEETLKVRKVPYVVGRGLYAYNPRGQIIGDTGGMLKLLFEAKGMTLVGAHVVGSSASELIHIGQAFLHSGATATQIAETLYNYPTLSDCYRHAGMEALWEKIKRDEHGAAEVGSGARTGR
jgi:NAD(P) transhydrogenase